MKNPGTKFLLVFSILGDVYLVVHSNCGYYDFSGVHFSLFNG